MKVIETIKEMKRGLFLAHVIVPLAMLFSGREKGEVTLQTPKGAEESAQ